MHDSNRQRRPSPAAQALDDVLRASGGVLDLLPIATFICDAHGAILQYNKRAVEIWGDAPRPGQTHDDFTKGGRRLVDLKGKACLRPNGLRRFQS